MLRLQLEVCLTILYIFGIKAGQVNLCTFHTNNGIVHRGSFAVAESCVPTTLYDVRSVTECVTYCNADPHCKSAIYQKNKICLLIDTYNSVSSTSSSSQLPDAYFVELQGAANCPTPCSGTSVCLMDCTADVSNPETTCVDLSGEQESCKFLPISWSKEYYLSNLDEESSQDNYIFFSVNFEKKYADTTIKVRFRGTLRAGYGAADSYGLWKLMFNASECNDPGKIESVHFNEDLDLNHHRASGIEGICKGLAAGTMEIRLTQTIYQSSISRVGAFTDASRLYVDEFGTSFNQSGEVVESNCPNLPVFNTREEAFTSQSNQNDSTQAIWSMPYRKLENETSLKINLDFAIGMIASESRCAMWYIDIDGSDCKPYPLGRILALLHDGDQISNEHRSVEVEGYCINVTSGLLNLSLYIDDCPRHAPGTGAPHTGFSAVVQRMIVEEFRAESNINTVMATDGRTLYGVPQLNMVIHSAFDISSDVEDGIVWSVTDYQKRYTGSGLRLTLSSDARNYFSAGECCRYFFVINDNECADPGPIEGVISINSIANSHSPLLIEGICEGIPAGAVKISVNTGYCKGESNMGNSYFGFNSYIQMMVSEAYVERETITY